MIVTSNNNLIATIRVLRQQKDWGLRQAKEALDAQESIPLDTTLYLDLLGVGTIVTLEGQEMIHARAIEAIIRQAEYDIQTLATRIDMGRALLLHPIGRDGVVEVET